MPETDVPPRWSRSWGATFDPIAVTYDAVRPGYPAELYDHLAAACGLGPGCRVLEIGCGTGQATRDVVARGATVVAVEPGASMAALARGNLGDAPVTIIESRFEDWSPEPPASFDLAVSATAFHWVEPAIGMQHVADALRPRGWLALWWMQFFDRERPDRFGQAVHPILERWDPRRRERSVAAKEADEIRRIGDGLLGAPAAREFDHIDERRFPLMGRHTASELRALWSTHSSVQTLPEPARTGLLDDVERLATERFGGVVERPYHVRCFTAQRR